MWADYTSVGDSKDPKPVEEKRHQDDDLNDPVVAEKTDVTLVHTQWWEKEPYWLVAMEPNLTQRPQMGQQQPEPEELSEDEYKVFDARAKEAGIRFQSAKMMRKVYKQAFVGAKILDHGPTSCPNEFSLNWKEHRRLQGIPASGDAYRLHQTVRRCGSATSCGSRAESTSRRRPARSRTTKR